MQEYDKGDVKIVCLLSMVLCQNSMLKIVKWVIF